MTDPTPRQKFVLDAIGEDGMYPIEAGALLHSRPFHKPRPHDAHDEWCLTCPRDGRSVLVELAAKGKIAKVGKGPFYRVPEELAA